MLGVAFIVIWFGLRPLTRMLIEQKTAEEAAALAAAGIAGGIDGMNVTEATAAILAAGGKPDKSRAAEPHRGSHERGAQRLAETPRADGRAR